MTIDNRKNFGSWYGPGSSSRVEEPHIEKPIDQRPDVQGDDHGERNPSCWSSSAGDSGFGKLPGRSKKLAKYDSSPASYDHPPQNWR